MFIFTKEKRHDDSGDFFTLITTSNPVDAGNRAVQVCVVHRTRTNKRDYANSIARRSKITKPRFAQSRFSSITSVTHGYCTQPEAYLKKSHGRRDNVFCPTSRMIYCTTIYILKFTFKGR